MSSPARTLVLVDPTQDFDTLTFHCLACDAESYVVYWIEALRDEHTQKLLKAFLDTHARSCGSRFVRGVLGIESNALRGEVLGVPVWGR